MSPKNAEKQSEVFKNPLPEYSSRLSKSFISSLLRDVIDIESQIRPVVEEIIQDSSNSKVEHVPKKENSGLGFKEIENHKIFRSYRAIGIAEGRVIGRNEGIAIGKISVLDAIAKRTDDLSWQEYIDSELTQPKSTVFDFENC